MGSHLILPTNLCLFSLNTLLLIGDFVQQEMGVGRSVGFLWYMSVTLFCEAQYWTGKTSFGSGQKSGDSC